MRLRQWQSECISSALKKFTTFENHFLCLATPGAGKTVMAATLVSQMFRENRIDLVLCFSPSLMVAGDFAHALSAHTNLRMDGLLGSKGRSLTYQAMLHLDSSFWKLFDANRIFVIFDEIHHCAGDGLGNANSWGQKIIENIQGRSAYTLALTGTPWRSDQIPIALARYSHENRIHCDYAYGLTQAVEDNVCRTPKITLIDNDRIIVKHNDAILKYSSFEELLKESKCSYQQLVEHEDLIAYVIDQSSQKLESIRKQFPNAGGLIIAATVEHANKIAQILYQRVGEKAYVATYREEDPLGIINAFKKNSEKWIISVGMISEGTNIPRLRVCCHLTRVKTELHFRQVLGRILRSDNEKNSEAFLFIPAEPNLIEYATRVAKEIPDGMSIKFDSMSKLASDLEADECVSPKGDDFSKDGLKFNLGNDYVGQSIEIYELREKDDLPTLAKSYEASVNIFGKFRQELISLQLGAH